MIVACHQPNFMPWIGFFYKALLADTFVLLDNVQFPRGFHWVNRNRLKSDQGELWLTVPVWKKGRGLQKISEVEIYDERGWSDKHLYAIVQNYTHAPHLPDYLDFLKNLYEHKWVKLIDFNLEILNYLKGQLGIKKEFNATQALHLACLVLGIGAGDEVIVPSLTFVATSNAVLYTGARVLFADILGPRDLTVSPQDIENKISPQTKAIMVMHYGGYPCQMHKIKENANNMVFSSSRIVLMLRVLHWMESHLEQGGTWGVLVFLQTKTLRSVKAECWSQIGMRLLKK